MASIGSRGGLFGLTLHTALGLRGLTILQARFDGEDRCVVGAGAWAVGGLSGNPQTAARGQKAIGVALLAAILLGGAAAILNLVYQAGGTIT